MRENETISMAFVHNIFVINKKKTVVTSRCRGSCSSPHFSVRNNDDDYYEMMMMMTFLIGSRVAQDMSMSIKCQLFPVSFQYNLMLPSGVKVN